MITQPNVDLRKLSETELKALAYDLNLKAQQFQNNVRIVEQELIRRMDQVDSMSKDVKEIKNKKEKKDEA